jgi:hypothetical protein
LNLARNQQISFATLNNQRLGKRKKKKKRKKKIDKTISKFKTFATAFVTARIRLMCGKVRPSICS